MRVTCRERVRDAAGARADVLLADLSQIGALWGLGWGSSG
jgi:hypothetical protein